MFLMFSLSMFAMNIRAQFMLSKCWGYNPVLCLLLCHEYYQCCGVVVRTASAISWIEICVISMDHTWELVSDNSIKDNEGMKSAIDKVCKVRNYLQYSNIVLVLSGEPLCISVEISLMENDRYNRVVLKQII